MPGPFSQNKVKPLESAPFEQEHQDLAVLTRNNFCVSNSGSPDVHWVAYSLSLHPGPLRPTPAPRSTPASVALPSLNTPVLHGESALGPSVPPSKSPRPKEACAGWLS